MRSKPDFEVVYQKYAGSIYRFLYWHTQDPVLSQDLASTVFERAWRSRQSFHGGSVQAWLYRIARNLLIDHWRRQKELFLDDLAGVSERLPSAERPFDYDQELLANRLAEALERLAAIPRLVVVLRFIEGLSAREVAAVVETSEGNIRIIQYRALKHLRELMKDQHEI